MYRIVLALVACSLLIACKSSQPEIDSATVFRYNESANITSLDPAFSKVQSNVWACNQLFNGLVQLDDRLRVQPDLAQSWQISPDGLTYRFHLRDSVAFHPSEQLFGPDSTRFVRAKDVVYSLERLRSPQLAAPGAWILQKVDHIRALDSMQVEVQLQHPFPAFLGLLAMKYASIVPAELAQLPAYDFAAQPIGTGPFKLQLWEENVKMVLRRNPRYFERDSQGKALPYLQAVAITFLPDKQSGFLQFLQGNLDFVSGLDPSYKDELLTQTGELQPRYAGQITMETAPYLNTEYLGFRLDKAGSVLQDLRLRLALNYGFDRKQLVLFMRNNMGIPAYGGIIPAGMPGQLTDTLFGYQPQKARELIASYVQEKGRPQIQLATNASYVDIAEFLQREWQKVGLDVKIEVNPPSTLRQSIATGQVEFFRGSWIADYPDAENYLSLLVSSNFAPNGPNYTHYSNPQFDALYQRVMSASSDSLRFGLYQQMDRLAMQQAPIIPLFYDKVARFTRSNVKGLGVNPLNMLTLKTVYKTK